MGVSNSWRPTFTMDDWMRDIEKRLIHEERRPSVPHPTDVVGRGFRPYAGRVEDWDSDGPIVGGHYFSVGDQVVNSPDDTKHWIGIVQSNPDGQGVQRVWQYLDDVDDDLDPETPPVQVPASDPTLYTRSFVTNEDGTRTYSTWVTGGSGGGGGAPSGPAGGDLTGTYPNPTIAANAVGAAEIIDGSVGSTELADSAVTSAKIADGTITDTDVAAANKDGAAATPSLRTLGTGATQAAAGNHTHTGMVVSFNGSLPALTAGTWTTVTHNLNRWPVAATFYESGTEVVLDFRIGAGASVNAIEVRSDLAVGAGVYTVLVTG